MVEINTESPDPIFDLKQKVEALKGKIVIEGKVVEAEKAKGPRADKAAIEAAVSNLKVLLIEAVQTCELHAVLLHRASKNTSGHEAIDQLTNLIMNEDQRELDDQIRDLLKIALQAEEAIPGVITDVQAAQLAETIAAQETLSQTEKIILYLYNQLTVMRAELEARPASQPEATDSNTGATPEAKAVSEVKKPNEQPDIKTGWLQKLFNRFAVRDLLQDTRGVAYYNKVMNILKNDAPTERVKILEREIFLLPILAALKDGGLLALTTETEDKITSAYPNEVAYFASRVNDPTRSNGTARLKLLMWARVNIHLFLKLPEVVGLQIVTQSILDPTEGTPSVGVNNEVSAQTLLNPTNAATTSSLLPETTTFPENENKKALFQLYMEIKTILDTAKTDDEKINTIADIQIPRRMVLLDEAVRLFRKVAEGDLNLKLDGKARDRMRILLTAAAVESFHNSIVPEILPYNELKEFIQINILPLGTAVK